MASGKSKSPKSGRGIAAAAAAAAMRVVLVARAPPPAGAPRRRTTRTLTARTTAAATTRRARRRRCRTRPRPRETWSGTTPPSPSERPSGRPLPDFSSRRAGHASLFSSRRKSGIGYCPAGLRPERHAASGRRRKSALREVSLFPRHCVLPRRARVLFVWYCSSNPPPLLLRACGTLFPLPRDVFWQTRSILLLFVSSETRPYFSSFVTERFVFLKSMGLPSAFPRSFCLHSRAWGV
uniref:Uncharacterized protein n=1 Tax=Ixodes ricinus TaxID=34613 RepID=A0A147BUA9_IXORI